MDFLIVADRALFLEREKSEENRRYYVEDS